MLLLISFPTTSSSFSSPNTSGFVVVDFIFAFPGRCRNRCEVEWWTWHKGQDFTERRSKGMKENGIVKERKGRGREGYVITVLIIKNHN